MAQALEACSVRELQKSVGQEMEGKWRSEKGGCLGLSRRVQKERGEERKSDSRKEERRG